MTLRRWRYAIGTALAALVAFGGLAVVTRAALEVSVGQGVVLQAVCGLAAAVACGALYRRARRRKRLPPVSYWARRRMGERQTAADDHASRMLSVAFRCRHPELVEG